MCACTHTHTNTWSPSRLVVYVCNYTERIPGVQSPLEHIRHWLWPVCARGHLRCCALYGLWVSFLISFSTMNCLLLLGMYTVLYVFFLLLCLFKSQKILKPHLFFNQASLLVRKYLSIYLSERLDWSNTWKPVIQFSPCFFNLVWVVTHRFMVVAFDIERTSSN